MTTWGWSCLDLYLVPTCLEHQKCPPAFSLLTIYCSRILSPLEGDPGRKISSLGFQQSLCFRTPSPHGSKLAVDRDIILHFRCPWQDENKPSPCSVLLCLRRHPRHGSGRCCMQGRTAPHHPPNFYFLSSPDDTA